MEYINKLFLEDNLELLKRLPDKCIDLIYCDILYNTGKKFNDYDDNLGTPQEAIEWYRPRLVEMKRVMKDTGSIYLQCDYRLVHYLKIEMDNIFGLNNFRNEIIWSYNWGGRPKDNFAKKHDNILYYTKTTDFYFSGDDIRIPYKTDIKGRKNALVSKEKHEKGQIPTNVWEIPILHTMGSERNGYSTQKPKSIAERIVKASSQKGDLVADFFCGSGTTCVVAKELGRNYIGCDIGEKAIKITKQRLGEEYESRI